MAIPDSKKVKIGPRTVGYCLSNMLTTIMYINFLYTSQVLRMFILILLWNQGILHLFKNYFLERKHNKIIHLREQLKLSQTVIINQKMMKLSLEWVKGKNNQNIWSWFSNILFRKWTLHILWVSILSESFLLERDNQ